MASLLLFPAQIPTRQEIILEGNSKMVILGNSIDMGLADDFLEGMRQLGFNVVSLHPSQFSTQRMADLIIILGGPDAYEGTGGIVRSLLNSSMMSEVRKRGASFLLELHDVWKEGQTVLIAMGSDRNGTRRAYQQSYDRILSTIAPRLQLSGEIRIKGKVITSSLRLGPDVTVHLDGDTMIVSLGPLEVTGKVVGECAALALISSSNITLQGEVNNSCPSHSPEAIPPNQSTENVTLPGVLVWGARNVTIDANITTSGEIMVSSGPNPLEVGKRLESGQNLSGASRVPPSQRNKPRWLPWVPPNPVRQQQFRNFIIVKNSKFVQRDRGGCVWQRLFRPQKSWVLAAWGDIYIKKSYFKSRDGRGGCNRTTDGKAVAGNGEHGVILSIFVEGFKLGGLGPRGNLVVEDTTFRTGNGGKGGSAIASPGRDGNAEARGGKGGWGGGFLIEVDGYLEFKGTHKIVLGGGGRGGDAKASGAKGEDGCPGHNGGNATAEAGEGGGASYRMVSGSFRGPVPSISGGMAGNGGDAEAIPGDGGDGNATSCDGGMGGNARAIAGKGGKATLSAPGGISPVSGFEGGDGGNVSVSGGNGGDGASGCIYENETFKKGGRGGKGGNVTAKSGSHGIGALGNGKDGTIEVRSASNGGDGGDGNPPGPGGLPGAKNITDPSGKTSIKDSFNRGQAGNPCLGSFHPDPEWEIGVVCAWYGVGRSRPL